MALKELTFISHFNTWQLKIYEVLNYDLQQLMKLNCHAVRTVRLNRCLFVLSHIMFKCMPKHFGAFLQAGFSATSCTIRPFCERSVKLRLSFPLPCLPLASNSSDSDGHFDTPEEATPVHGPKTFPGELENSSADPDKTGEAAAEQAGCRKRGESSKGGKKKKNEVASWITNISSVIVHQKKSCFDVIKWWHSILVGHVSTVSHNKSVFYLRNSMTSLQL